MKKEEYDKLFAEFLKAFSSVPEQLRNQIIIVIEGQPYTWESAFIAVKTNSETSDKILTRLKKLEFI